MLKNESLPAFPEPVTDNGYAANGNLGLTKFEYVSINVLNGLLSNPALYHIGLEEQIVNAAFSITRRYFEKLDGGQ